MYNFAFNLLTSDQKKLTETSNECPGKAVLGLCRLTIQHLAVIFPFENCAWQSSVMEISSRLLLMEIIFTPYLWTYLALTTIFFSFHCHYWYFFISLAGHTGFSTVELLGKTISAFRSEWVCFLIRPKWLIKSWSRLYQTTFMQKREKKVLWYIFISWKKQSFVLYLS